MASEILRASAELYVQRLRLAHKLMESDRVHESLMLTIKGHGDYLEALMHEVDPDPDAIEVTQNYLSGTLDLLAIELFGNEPIFIH